MITNRRRANFWLPRAIELGRRIKGMIDGAKFNLDFFGDTLESTNPANFEEASLCGFEGCLAGWCGLGSQFRRAGLRYKDGTLQFRGDFGFESLAYFFGVTESAATIIFGISDRNWPLGSDQSLDPHNPDHAVERLIRFCKDHDVPVPAEEGA